MLIPKNSYFKDKIETIVTNVISFNFNSYDKYVELVGNLKFVLFNPILNSGRNMTLLCVRYGFIGTYVSMFNFDGNQFSGISDIITNSDLTMDENLTVSNRLNYFKDYLINKNK